MPRRIFPAASVTNTTGNPVRLTFHADAATGRREADLWTIDGSNNLSERIPNGVVVAGVTGAYSAFAGPDDLDTLYVSVNDGSRAAITATGYVASSVIDAGLAGTYAPLSSTTIKPQFGGLTLGNTAVDPRVPVKSSVGISPSQAGTSDHVAHLFQSIVNGPWTETTGSDPNFAWGTNFFTLFQNSNDGLDHGYGGLIEADVSSAAGTTLGSMTGLQAECSFFGAGAGATVSVMRSMYVAAPVRKNGAVAGTATTVYGLQVGPVDATSVSATTAYGLFVQGGTGSAGIGKSLFGGQVEIHPGHADDISLKITLPPSPTANAITILDALLNTKARVTSTGAITSSNRLLAFEGQSKQVALGDLGPGAEAAVTLGSSSDTTLWRKAAGVLGIEGSVLLKASSAPSALAGYGGLYANSAGILHYKDPSGNDTAVGGAPRQVIVSALQTPKTTTGSWNYQINGSSYFCSYITNNGTSAQNDAITFYDVWLDAGTWQLDLLGTTGTDGGIATAALVGPDGTVSISGSQDQYLASTAAVRTNLTGTAITKAGLYTLVVTVATKNASSSSYRARISAGILTRTA